MAFVGLGPWGLASLERLLTVAGRRGVNVAAHVVEPGVPGVGIFSLDTPDFLLLNTPCGQHVMFPEMDGRLRPKYARSLYEWAVTEGYHWVGGECRRDASGAAISPHDFLPRRLMGEWLNWSYEQVVRHRPRPVSITHWRASAIDVEPGPEGGERVILDSGEILDVDHVIISTGHTRNAPVSDLPGELSPYPISELQHLIGAGQKVAVSGLGLVALDVVSALTVGRGGRFEGEGDCVRYLPSGQEPVIHLFSRSGRPYAAKAVGATDPTGRYRPVICTPEAANRLRRKPNGELCHGAVNFQRDFLPLIVAEMQARYFRQRAFLTHHDTGAADELVEQLKSAWSRGTFAQEIARLESQYGAFDVRRYLLPEDDDSFFSSSSEYETTICATIQEDAAQAIASSLSPLKTAFETVRALRDTMRTVIEFQGLDAQSHMQFFSTVANRFKALVAGPPVRRCLELLALMETGVVRIPWGPSPSIEPAEEGGFLLRSTRLAEPHAERVDHVVRGYLLEPTIKGTGSSLIANLSRRGRIGPMSYGTIDVGSVALSDDSHPIGRDGTVQDRLWIFGSLTEGARYFTQYVPSPQSRVRAFTDAEICADAILSLAADETRIDVLEQAV